MEKGHARNLSRSVRTPKREGTERKEAPERSKDMDDKAQLLQSA